MNEFSMSTESFDVIQERTWLHIRRYQALQWNDIVSHYNFLPELTVLAEKIIVRVLGYLPPNYIYYPHEKFIRLSIDSYKKGRTNLGQFWRENLFHIQQIRNEDMWNHCWPNYKFEEEKDIYFKYYEPFAALEIAQIRITQCLGYEPQIEHSYYPAMWLCDEIVKSGINVGYPLNDIDYRAATITKFREIYSKKGYEAANQSYFACERRDIEIEGLDGLGSDDTLYAFADNWSSSH